jgi:hypothetical protein
VEFNEQDHPGRAPTFASPVTSETEFTSSETFTSRTKTFTTDLWREKFEMESHPSLPMSGLVGARGRLPPDRSVLLEADSIRFSEV